MYHIQINLYIKLLMYHTFIMYSTSITCYTFIIYHALHFTYVLYCQKYKSIFTRTQFMPSSSSYLLYRMFDTKKKTKKKHEYLKLVSHDSHFFHSMPSGGWISTLSLPTSFQFVLRTVPPLSTNDLFMAFLTSSLPSE